MNLIPLRRATAAAAVLSLSLALTACGGDEESADDPAPSTTSEVSPTEDPTEDPTGEPTETDDDSDDDSEEDDGALSEDDLEQALLTAADLPGGYVLDPDEDDDDEQDPFAGSCLEEIGNLTDQPEFEADGEAEANFILESEAGQSSIQSQVQSYVDEQEVISAIAMFSEVVSTCTEATGTDPDGTSYALEILSDQTVSLDGVDEQSRVAINGTITSQGVELPVDLGFNVARIANNIVIISTADIGEVGEGIVSATDTTAQVSVDRLAEITG